MMKPSATSQTARTPTADDIAMGLRLKARRMAAGETQESLGNKAGISWQMVQKYEKGASRMTAGRVQQFAQILGCSTGDILNADDAADLPPMHREQLDLVRDYNAITDFTDREAVRGLARKLASKAGSSEVA